MAALIMTSSRQSRNGYDEATKSRRTEMTESQQSERLADQYVRNIRESVTALNGVLPSRKWYTVFRSKKFMAAWNRTATLGGGLEGYELAICGRAYACGCSDAQVLTLIKEWRRKHKIAGNFKRLLDRVMPKAKAAARSYVQSYEAAQQARKTAGRKNGEVSRTALAYVAANGFCTSKEISEALEIGPKHASMTLLRLTRRGLLTRTGKSYSLAAAQLQPGPRLKADEYDALSWELDQVWPYLVRCLRSAIFAQHWKRYRELEAIVTELTGSGPEDYAQHREALWAYCDEIGIDLASHVAEQGWRHRLRSWGGPEFAEHEQLFDNGNAWEYAE
ncbi:MAG: hypothetical protein LLG20_24995 [Acidobacteriales bacterium]|nr:hypothetical protein [Terriglobales bacterium]